ncbi:hypothetical protein [Flavitalea sp.]|nr:hypothetical protein [Flavitalea sp.]
MNNELFSNAVATISRLLFAPAIVELQHEETDTYGDEYIKAIEGSYDRGYFTEPGSGKFRMPSYNKDWTGQVKIKDCTNYKEAYYGILDKDEKAKYTIDDFEYKFPFVWFEVQDFQTFLSKLPAASFNKGLKREQVIMLFDEYENFIKGDKGDYTDLSDEKYKKTAVELGLLEIIDQADKTLTEIWQQLQPSQLREICKKNKLESTGKSASMIKSLIAANIKFHFELYQPSELLKQCHAMFVDMYLDDLRMGTDHLHPLYFNSLWDQICRENYLVETLEAKVKEIIKNPFWAVRLCKAVRLEDSLTD